MNHDSWLAKADQLRAELEQLKAADAHERGRSNVGDGTERERVLIARWLRSEFSDELPEDTATIALFPDQQ
jgi:hypothetical protein